MGAQAGVLDVTEYAHLCGCPQPTRRQLGAGVPPVQLLVPQGTDERGQREPTVAWRLTGCWAQPGGGDASSSEQAEVSCCGKWYCTAASVPSTSPKP